MNIEFNTYDDAINILETEGKRLHEFYVDGVKNCGSLYQLGGKYSEAGFKASCLAEAAEYLKSTRINAEASNQVIEEVNSEVNPETDPETDPEVNNEGDPEVNNETDPEVNN